MLKPWQKRALLGLAFIAIYLLGMHTSALTSFVAGLETSPSDESTSWSLPPVIDGEVRVIEGLAFAQPEGSGPLQLDLYLPPTSPHLDAIPVIVGFHGGGFTGGDRGQYESFARGLAERGYAVASADYRKYPAWHIQDTLEDARCAVRWLRAHASEHGLDATRVGAMGRSSGGYLALMLATGDGEEGDGSACPRASSAVSFVISEAGPTNLDPLLWEGTWRGHALQGYFGDADPRALSPAMRINARTPPALLFHGTSDSTVPYTQSRLFEAGMHAANRPVRMVSFARTEHDPLSSPIGEIAIGHWSRGQREILHFVSEQWLR